MATGSLRRLTILFVSGTLTACVGTSWEQPPSAEDAGPDVVAPAADAGATANDAPRPAPEPPAADATTWLLDDARTLAAAGEWDRAAAQVERAMRIDRGNPWLYLELARIRGAQGEPEQSRMLLDRARALAGGDPAVLERARVLADANGSGAGAP